MGLELLGTIHWLAKHDDIPLEYDKIFFGIKNWCSKYKGNLGARKIKLFPEDLIQKGIERIKTIM